MQSQLFTVEITLLQGTKVLGTLGWQTKLPKRECAQTLH